MSSAWPSIPSWEEADLQQLSSLGQLSGVNPLILGVMDSEESSGQGGGINPEGYGGFFGLGANKSYPGGTSTSAMLSDPGQTSFEQQAEIAASAFASYLTSVGGDPIKAEEIYQSGSPSGPTPGSQLLQQYLGSTPTTEASSLPGGIWDPLNIPNEIIGGAGSAAASAAGPIVNEALTWATKAMFIALGLGLAALGIWKMANPGKSASTSTTTENPLKDLEGTAGGGSKGGSGGAGAAALPELAA